MSWYGSWSGPTSNTKFRVCMNMRTNSQGETQGHIQIRRWVEVEGSFSGTILDTSWAGSVTLYNEGTYADSGWVDVGWITYGSSTSQSANASYTGSSGTYRSSSVSAKYSPTVPTWKPNACSVCGNVRVTDNKNTVSWTGSPTTARPYEGITVERQMDGGSWSVIASLAGGSTSWNDSSTNANHGYRYRVVPYNSAGKASSYAVSDVTYNTPAAPTKVSAVRKSSTTVSISIENPANTATALELQRSTDGTTWETVQTCMGAPVTSLEDNPEGGTFYYRARNTRGQLISDWSPSSDSVTTVCAPSSPTLLEPASGMVLPKTQEEVSFYWIHSPIDGSMQTKAELQYSLDAGSTWETVAVEGDAQSVAVPNSFEVNSSISWRVRTKGVHDDFGPWSDIRLLRVCQVPSIVVTHPNSDEALVEDVPIAVSWEYDDPSGIQRDVAVTIRDEMGGMLWSRTVQGTATSILVDASEILLPNESSFEISLAASSTSGLSASAVRMFHTSYEEPATPSLDIAIDEVYGRVLLIVGSGDEAFADEEAAATFPTTTSLGVFRKNPDGRLVALANGMQGGAGVVDVYPPLDQELTYTLPPMPPMALRRNARCQRWFLLAAMFSSIMEWTMVTPMWRKSPWMWNGTFSVNEIAKSSRPRGMRILLCSMALR